MPIQTPQWTEYLSCPVCENGFELKIRLPISLGCGHTICKTCLSNLQRSQCPFDLVRLFIYFKYNFLFIKHPVPDPLCLFPKLTYNLHLVLYQYTLGQTTRKYSLGVVD